MRLLKFILLTGLLVVLPLLAQAATEQTNVAAVMHAAGEAVTGTVEHAEAGHVEHHGLPAAAPQIKLGPLTVTNSMIMTWVVAIAIIVFAQFATRKIQAVPSGAQNFWEFLVEGLYGFLEGIIGHQLVKKTFWFFATIFIFILFTNWAGLLRRLVAARAVRSHYR